ncbi:hypothetical protein CWATWH8502_2019 [Crocosphaera watsonii WH 8502]|uniref:Uncharacterized protein n=4 Tax=Crocosphaera watsonii TaxID=263511 RepID=T2JLW3_CROWT|nr:hypothetical protein CWATWH8502_2019 [Crocosphaera watsonii WH 8502]CCQ55559.1 hypothetical protein CWATWH0005_1784 [Crocosphaera watsonii WH 0005]CCQ63412.1 hypothetical protein CWATWH0401_2257 [Crocosphaera watsonii WH 0401]CCQ66833.1 hypothetical protein CWATWH0402_3107 [Crocosphaera watsonii WH 0402]
MEGSLGLPLKFGNRFLLSVPLLLTVLSKKASVLSSIFLLFLY